MHLQKIEKQKWRMQHEELQRKEKHSSPKWVGTEQEHSFWVFLFKESEWDREGECYMSRNNLSSEACSILKHVLAVISSAEMDKSTFRETEKVLCYSI